MQRNRLYTNLGDRRRDDRLWMFNLYRGASAYPACLSHQNPAPASRSCASARAGLMSPFMLCALSEAAGAHLIASRARGGQAPNRERPFLQCADTKGRKKGV